MVITYPAPLPVQTTTFNKNAIPTPFAHDFGESIRLLGYDLQPMPDALKLTLFWQARQAVEENYRSQIELVDPQKKGLLTWISHPLNGLYPTRSWDKGDIIRDTLYIPLVTIAAQKQLTLQLTLIHETRNDSLINKPLTLTTLDWAGHNNITPRVWTTSNPARYRQTIAVTKPDMPITLIGPDNQPRPPLIAQGNFALFMVGADWPSGDYHLADLRFTVANDVRLYKLPEIDPHLWIPVEANFANQVKLLGYTLPNRRAAAGGGLPITLYWQSLAPVLGDYIVFNKLLDPAQKVYGGYDRLPREYYSTILWAENEIIEDGFGLPISPAAPNGIYTLDVGLYSLATGAPVSLPLIQNGQTSEQKSVRLGPIKVGGAPSNVIISHPPIFPPESGGTEGGKINLNQSFADSMTLLGYDLTQNGTTLQLTLYWQATDRPNADYTTFVHLRDATNHNAAQQDGPPGQGRYPTSLWDKGNIVPQSVTLSLDNVTPGRYQLVIGLYDAVTGNRLPFADSPQNELSLSEIIK